jgi:hypothetical protein
MYNNILNKPLRMNPNDSVSPTARNIIEGVGLEKP